jgi:hypothetical protein
VEKYGDNTYNTARAHCFTGLLRLPTHIQSMVILIAFHGNTCYTNAPQFYVCMYNPCLVKFMKQSSFLLYLILILFK